MSQISSLAKTLLYFGLNEAGYIPSTTQPETLIRLKGTQLRESTGRREPGDGKQLWRGAGWEGKKGENKVRDEKMRP